MRAFAHPATPFVGSAAARLLASFERMDADEIMETYEAFEDEACARDRARDQGAEFSQADLL